METNDINEKLNRFNQHKTDSSNRKLDYCRHMSAKARKFSTRAESVKNDKQMKLE